MARAQSIFRASGAGIGWDPGSRGLATLLRRNPRASPRAGQGDLQAEGSVHPHSPASHGYPSSTLEVHRNSPDGEF